MNTDLTITLPNTLTATDPTARAAASALELLLSDTRSEETRRAYARDLCKFFTWHANTDPTPAAIYALCSMSAGELAITLNGYKAAMREQALGEATINRRLAALRSLLRMARRLGADIPDPSGLVSSEKVTTYRDTRGPALNDAARLLDAPDRTTTRGKRDYALLLLLCENALRRGELHKCNVADYDPAAGRLDILGKGRGTQKETITLSPAAVEALNDYLNARRADTLLTPADPLFANAAHFTDGNQRLAGRGLLFIVNAYGEKVLGHSLHPHALRHMAITAVLDATGGDVRTAQRLSRHKDLRTLSIYDDNRADLQGKATLMLSALLKGNRA